MLIKMKKIKEKKNWMDKKFNMNKEILLINI